MTRSASILVAIAVAAGARASGSPFRLVIVDERGPRDPWMKAIGDLDGDDRSDLLVTGREGPVVYYRSPDWHKVVIAAEVRSPGSSTGMEVGDVDGDGDLDVLLANGQWFENPRPQRDSASGAWPAHSFADVDGHDVVVGDLDGDGALDVVTRGQWDSGNRVRVFRQNNPHSWTERGLDAPFGEGIALADLDADGHRDILIPQGWYQGSGNVGGPWTPRPAWAWPEDGVVATGDINGDGRVDVVLSESEGSHRLSWFEAPTDLARGDWTEHRIEQPFDFAHSLGVADVDRDGDLDVVSAEMHQSQERRVAVFANGGAGAVWTMEVLSREGSHNLRLADIDQDGDPDFFGANWSEEASDRAVIKLWVNETPAPPVASRGR